VSDQLFVPADFTVPDGLTTGEFRLEPLGPQHNTADYAAWTASIGHIRATPGFAGASWPHQMSLAENLRDLERHFATAVLLVHHARKGAAHARAGQALRGSSELHAWGDSNLYLRRQGDTLRLSIEHRAAPSRDGLLVELQAHGEALALHVVERYTGLKLRKRELDEGTLLVLEKGRVVHSHGFRPDDRYEESPLPAVRAPREGEFCLERLAALAAAA